MFTGIVEEVGTVRAVRLAGSDTGIDIAAQVVTEGTRVGDSIAVSGVCLTVTRVTANGFTAGMIPETLRRTTLGRCTRGSPVNLERSVVYGGRVGGHLVQGHVDTTGHIISRQPEGAAIVVRIGAPPAALRYVVAQGAIAVDGVSLTVVEVDARGFTVSLVSHTQGHSTLADLGVGASVNLEVDILAKYVERLVQPPATGISADWLAQMGLTAGGGNGWTD